jgi:hypothetical protein
MFALVYLSEAHALFDDPAVAELADKAAAKNGRLQITGYLHYRTDRQTFFQYLEGPQPAVLELMDVIVADPRHRVINLIRLGEIKQRLFPTWSMRYLSDRYFHMIQMEDVLEGVLLTMREKVFDRETVVDTVMRLARYIASRKSG